FLADPRVEVVVVLLPPGAAVPDWVEELAPRVRVAPGGETRTASVAAGLDVLPDGIDTVVVHDAARPRVDLGALDRCLAVAAQDIAAVVGHPAVDTIKEVEDGVVQGTPDRRRLWQVQTPQVFPRTLLQHAHAAARATGVDGTDDAALIERAGLPVQVVEGSRWNLKVTVPEDRAVAESLLARAPRRSAPPSTERGWAALVTHVRSGGLIAYPTGTVYGFGGAATPEGVAALARLKHREVARKPFLILLEGPDAAPGLAWSEEARRLSRAFWPGPLTLIVGDPRRTFPAGVRGPEGGVAVRVDAHPVATEIVRRLGAPLTSSSANAPGQPPATDGRGALEALEALGADASVWVIDAGPVSGGASSTLVDMTGPTPRLIRAGALPPARIREHVRLDG
ncbi:MAG: 2-C-methyl-D-erythritol 4-phosphate cytidylyltransferase, partial [Gemmatimonadetes bacterium]|nr:2-C-methyl-D-erythritol 4-phosphate cytidylyltransferase [Gemmatimonadota bacterium]